mmetsp:Transcript_17600/g.38779  ORF Transcript_17600/g.38779 Transcript_17600/m.38779 type:complete len:460 (-) Transcript_17600:47-1426(-)
MDRAASLPALRLPTLKSCDARSADVLKAPVLLGRPAIGSPEHESKPPLRSPLEKTSPLERATRRTRRTKTCPALEVEAAVARQDLEAEGATRRHARRKQRTKTCPSSALQNIQEDREATSETMRVGRVDSPQSEGRSLKFPGSPLSSGPESLPEPGGPSSVHTPSTSASTPGAHLIIQNWRSGASIGHGSYGSVARALDVDNGFIFAVKKSTVTQSDEEDRKYLAKLREELDILRSLRHPNIICYLGHEYTGGTLYIFMELAEGGSLAKLLKEFGALEGALLRNTILGMLQGLVYLHTRNPVVVHRDIKSANVLLDLDFNVKLADFGCSKQVYDMSTSFHATGSFSWMAPEVILEKQGFGRKADIWSFGCTALESSTALPPWGKGAIDGMLSAVKLIGLSQQTPPIPESTLPSLKNLLQSCLQRAPDARPAASELLSHEYFMPPMKDKRRHHDSRVAWS